MTLKDILKVPPIDGSVKQNFDWEFLSRIAEKIEGFNVNKRIFKLQKKHALNNHFNIGTARGLSDHILGKNSCPMLTSTTSVHVPHETIPEETKQEEQEIKQKLKSPSGVNKVLNVYQPSSIKANTETRSRSAQQARKKKVNIINKKLKALYGNLKKTTMNTHFKAGSNDKLYTEDPLKKKLKVSKSRQSKVNILQTYTAKIEIGDKTKSDDEYTNEFDADNLDKVGFLII